MVLVAAGGTLVELVHDRRPAFPPLDETRALRLIDGLRASFPEAFEGADDVLS